MIPQQEQQAIDTAMQNNYLQQQAYPFQTTGWLGNLIEGTGSASGGTGTTSSPGPSTASQAAGGITSGLGILGSLMSLSDARVKEDMRPIGKTFDGQTIYRFRFKGDPRTQIGLIAQEAEKKHPHSVGEGLGGLKHIDYSRATERSADRGHFQGGGMIRPGYDVGGMTPEFLGQNGAIGVYTPGYNPSSGSGEELGPLAGVNEALAGAESAGQKNPYTGIDFDQIEAISSGQWMPPQTNSPAPNYTNPGASPQTSGAEASLAGLINRPGIETEMTPGGVTTPQAGTSAGPGMTGPGAFTAAMNATMPQNQRGSYMGMSGQGGPSGMPSGGATQGVGMTGQNIGRMPAINQEENAWSNVAGNATFADGGRARLASGGDPQFTEVQYPVTSERGRNSAPIYTALDLSGKGSSTPVPTPAPEPEHPAVTMARHIRQQSNAPANNNRAPAPAAKTGTDDPPFVQPAHPSTMRYPMWPTPGASTASGSGGPLDPDPFPGPTPRFGAKIPPDLTPPKEDPLGWSVGENPPGAAPDYLTPSAPSIGGILRGAGRMIGGPWGAAAGRVLESSPAETGELPPQYWPRDAIGAPSRPVTPSPRSNVIPLPNQSTGRPPIALHGPSGPIDLGTWGNEGGAPGPYVPDPMPRDPNAEMQWGDEGPVNYALGGRLARAAGGQLGQSGFGAALDQPPLGTMMSGPSSSPGNSQGGFAAANQAAGFDQLYGAGRSGFASGGDPSALSPYANTGAVSWVPSPSTGMMGQGPPKPPQVPSQGSGAAAATNQGADLSKAIEKIGQQFKAKGTATGTPSPGASPPTISMPSSGSPGSGLGGLGDAAGTPDFSNLSDDTFTSGGGGADLGGGFDEFARGGRLARAAGGSSAPTPTDAQIEAAFPTDDPTAAPVPATAAGAIAASAPPVSGNVGKGGYDPNAAIQKAFGDRAGYAATISNRESGQGANWVGDDGSSFGDFQLHYGGVSQKYPHPGLGDAFTAATGMDARNNDPATRTAVANFVANYTAKNGWGAWSTAHDAPASAGGSGAAGGAAPSLSGGVGADGLPQPMAVPPSYFQPRDYSDPNSSKRELFGAMMAAGFGMMAGTSPYAAVNIGQGGLAGVNYLQKQQELDRDWMLNQSKIDQMSAQERRADADVGLRVNQWNLELAKYKNVMQTNQNVANILGGGGSGSGAAPAAAPAASSPAPATFPGSTGPHGVAPSNMGDVGVGAPLVGQNIVPANPASPGAPAPAYGGPGAATPKITPTSAAAPLVAQGGSGKPASAPPAASAPNNVPSREAQPVASPVAPGGGATPAAAPAASAPSGAPGPQDPFWQGKSQNPYKFMQAGMALASSPDPQQQARGQELIKQAQEIWSSGMADGQLIPGVLEQKNILEAQKPIYQKFQEDKQKFEQNYDITRGQLGELSHIYSNFQAGRQSEAEADLASWANAAGFKLPQAAGFDSAMKSAMLQAFDQVNASGLQKAPRASLREAILTVASPTKDPAALRKIMSDSMATLDYNHDLYNNVNSYDTTKGVSQFTGTHKYEDYVKKAQQQIPMFKGITPETLKNTTGEEWPAPPLPKGLPSGTKYSPSTQKWWDPSGKSYNADGTPG
jgi:hypothetical protein